MATAVAGLVVALLNFALGSGALSNFVMSRSTDARVEVTALWSRELEDLPGVGPVVKIDMILINLSSPQAELHNVVGQIWTDTKHLAATIKQSGVEYRERQAADRSEFLLQFPLLPKLSNARLPTFAYRPPLKGEDITLGANIVSAETDYRQWIWKIVGQDGVPAFTIVEPGTPVSSGMSLWKRLWWAVNGGFSGPLK